MIMANNLAANLVTDAARALAAQDGHGQTERILRHTGPMRERWSLRSSVDLLAEAGMRRYLNRRVAEK